LLALALATVQVSVGLSPVQLLGAGEPSKVGQFSARKIPTKDSEGGCCQKPPRGAASGKKLSLGKHCVGGDRTVLLG